MKERGLLCMLSLLFTFTGVDALMCYWCSGVGDDRDCERHPYEVRTGPIYINCSSKFCITAKVTDAKTRKVMSFARLCDNIPRGNQCVRDSRLITCYESCTQDFCNDGNPGQDYLETVNIAMDKVDDNTEKSGDLANSMRAIKKEVYRYNNLEASRGFQEPMIEQDGNSKVQNLLEGHKGNSTSSPPDNAVNLQPTGKSPISDVFDEKMNTKSAKVLPGLENETADDGVDATRTRKKISTLQKEKNITGASHGNTGLLFGPTTTTQEWTNLGNLVNDRDDEFRSETKQEKDDKGVTDGMVMAYPPSHYLYTRKAEKNSVVSKNKRLSRLSTFTKSQSTTSTQRQMEGNVDPFPTTLIPSASYQYKPRVSPPFPNRASSQETQIKPSNGNKLAVVPKFTTSEQMDNPEIKVGPKKVYSLESSKNPSIPLVRFAEPLSNSSDGFGLRHRQMPRTPDKYLELSTVTENSRQLPRIPIPVARRRHLAFQGPQESILVDSDSYSSRTFSSRHQPIIPPASQIPLVSTYMNPVNHSGKIPHFTQQGSSSSSPAYGYADRYLPSNETLFSKVKMASNDTSPVNEVRSSASPKLDLTSEKHKNTNHSDFNIRYPADEATGDARALEAFARGESENDIVGPEQEYFLEDVESMLNQLLDDYDPTLVEPNYEQDSLDNLVSAFRQHPGNWYPVLEKAKNNSSGAEPEGMFLKNSSAENELSMESLNHESSSNHMGLPEFTDVNFARHTNSTLVSNGTITRHLENSGGNPILAWSPKLPTPFKPRHLDDKTVSTYRSSDLEINHSILITDSPLALYGDGLKLETSSQTFQGRLKNTNRRNDIKNSGVASEERKTIKTTFKDNLNTSSTLNEVDASLHPTIMPSNVPKENTVSPSMAVSSAYHTVQGALGIRVNQTVTDVNSASSGQNTEIPTGTTLDDITTATVSEPEDHMSESTATSAALSNWGTKNDPNDSQTTLDTQENVSQNRNKTNFLEENLTRAVILPSTYTIAEHPTTSSFISSSGSDRMSESAATDTETETERSAVDNAASPNISVGQDFIHPDVHLPQLKSEGKKRMTPSVSVTTEAAEGHNSSQSSASGRPRNVKATGEGKEKATGAYSPEGKEKTTGAYSPEGNVKATGAYSPEGKEKVTGAYSPEGNVKATGAYSPEGNVKATGAYSPEGTQETTSRPRGQLVKKTWRWAPTASTTSQSLQQQQASHPQKPYSQSAKFINLSGLNRSQSSVYGTAREISPRTNTRFRATRWHLSSSLSTQASPKAEQRQMKVSFGHVHTYDAQSNSAQKVILFNLFCVLWIASIAHSCRQAV